MTSTSLSCSNCQGDVGGEDSFCPHCGALFDDHVRCAEHPEEEADGVCVLCSTACCAECGRWRNDIFLCGTHEDYELFGERARVFGSRDVVSAEYAAQSLRRAGLHPSTHAPAARPHGGQVDPWSGETKVLVPFAEVPEAERVLSDLAILPP